MIHDAYPEDDEPCWGCIRDFSDKQLQIENERYRNALTVITKCKYEDNIRDIAKEALRETNGK